MLEAKVEAFLKRHCFKLENMKIVVGVSGGPDSLALLYYLHKERGKRNLTIIAAHVDHMFRGKESFEDALFVKRFCEQYEIPFEMARIHVAEIMEAEGKSAQIAAREARYDFYGKIMDKYQSSFLALGHHGDDQIETVLMRLTRGSTGAARAGIPFSRSFHSGTLFRPFLCLTKADILEYCKKHQLTPRMDPSNKKSIYSRNRFRHEVLPFLKSENHKVHEHFQRFSEELQMDETFLQALTKEKMNTVVKIREEQKITINIQELLGLPLPLQRRGIQLILNYLYREKTVELSAVHIDQIFYLIHYGGPSGELYFPNNLRVIRSYLDLTFQFHQFKGKEYYFELKEPGSVVLPNEAVIHIQYNSQELQGTHPYQAVFNAEKIKWPIIIRTRKPGDRMTLKGMKGTKKIKDIFIDQKIPLSERDEWPVVTDGDGSIIWLPGLKKSSFEGTEKLANQYLIITYKQ
ncbi:tRNA lysidine(34) synthetase TilS [Neobacillus sp.]|jgi:tRNA(Ile)-lysidine synthase|uniref:tRNA lysidine(34) synthetase TilS n=1 Tax=Neobacillus sp. TaxID=2675273 RepID=UPI0035B52077